MQHVCLLRLGHSLRQQVLARHLSQHRLLLPRIITRGKHGSAQEHDIPWRKRKTEQRQGRSSPGHQAEGPPLARGAGTKRTRSHPKTSQERPPRVKLQIGSEAGSLKGGDNSPKEHSERTHTRSSPTKRKFDSTAELSRKQLNNKVPYAARVNRKLSKLTSRDEASKSQPEQMRHWKLYPTLKEDARLRFIEEFDSLKDESKELGVFLNGFAKNEEDQRLRLESLLSNPDATEVGTQRKETVFAKYDEWKSALRIFRSGLPVAQPKSIAELRQIAWVQKCNSVEEMEGIWPIVPDRMMHVLGNMSTALLSTAIRHVPDKVHLVFAATLSRPSRAPPWYVVEDVVELLAMRLRDIGLDKIKPLAAHSLADKVINILSKQQVYESVQFSQVTIHSILAALPAAEIEPWYEELCALGCSLHPYTELHFVSCLAKSSATKALSAHCLRRLKETKLLDINTPLAASVATAILSFSKKDIAELNETSATPADLFRHLHSIGLVPNVITYTTIIRGLCLKEDLETAMEVYQVMRQHGVEPNEWTYSVLLNGCRTQADWTAFSEIGVQACHANIRDSVVWNEVLRAIYTCVLRTEKTESGPRRTALFAMSSIYSRLFDAQAIRPFITGRLTEMGEFSGKQQWFPEPLARLISEVPPLPPLELMQPRAETIAVMILGLLRCLPMPYDVVVFYSQYRHMLKSGHPIALRMVQEQGTFVHDIVLRNLIKWPNTMRVALDIIKDMMMMGEDDKVKLSTTSVEGTPAPSNEEVVEFTQPGVKKHPMMKEPSAAERQATAKEEATAHQHPDQQLQTQPGPMPISHPKPSVHTWTILIHGFMREKKPKDAEFIMRLMQDNGVEPNIVTWNTLVAGYARMQLIPEAVKSMRRLEAAGHEADDWTMRAFRYIRDKARAVELMEATVEANAAHKKAADEQQHEADKDREADALLGDTEALLLEYEQRAKQPTQQAAAEQTTRHTEQTPEQSEQRHNEDEEAFLDRLVEERLNSLGDLNPQIMSADKSRAIYARIIQRLEARGSPVTERDRVDVEKWLEVRSRGFKALPKAAPRPVTEVFGPTQAEVKARLGPWTMFSEAELDAMGLRIKPTPEKRPNNLDYRPEPVVKPLRPGLRFQRNSKGVKMLD